MEDSLEDEEELLGAGGEKHDAIDTNSSEARINDYSQTEHNPTEGLDRVKRNDPKTRQNTSNFVENRLCCIINEGLALIDPFIQEIRLQSKKTGDSMSAYYANSDEEGLQSYGLLLYVTFFNYLNMITFSIYALL